MPNRGALASFLGDATSGEGLDGEGQELAACGWEKALEWNKGVSSCNEELEKVTFRKDS